MSTGTWQTIPAMFFDWAGRRGDRPFLWGKDGKSWKPVSWRTAAIAVRSLARGLADMGVVPGDRVAIVVENRPEWVLADLAIMAAGAITVPAYITYTTEDYRHVLADSGAKVLIVGSNALGQRVLPAVDQLSDLTAVIGLERQTRQSSADIFTWDEIVTRGEASSDRVDETVAGLGGDDTACLMYTSGTGGVPKGVMLTHRNLMENARGAKLLLESAYTLANEVFLSFLPLTHSYEHTAGIMFPISIGAEIYFTVPETLAADMGDVRPTIMTAVPRLCEALQKRIVQTAERTGGYKLKLFRDAIRLGSKRYHAPDSLSLAERVYDGLLEKLVRGKIRKRFGGKLKAFVSGGAPLNIEVGMFFIALGLNLIQGYGQTEAGPVVGCNPPNRIKVDTVGPPLDGVELSIAADGEILVRGANVMKGYWRDPESTGRTILDGWLHTGDIGELDGDGYLKITDRKRDFIKNSGGDMISPARIEGFLTLQPGIGQGLVHGDRKPYVVALIVPDDEVLASHVDGGLPASRDPAVQKAVADAVAKVNQGLTPPERIRRHAILDEAFTVANGQMTPTLKIKRHIIRQAYGALLESLYETKGVA